MDDLKKKEKEQTAAIAKLVSENAHHEQSGYSQPYRCANCNERVNYTFILPFLKARGICPDCWHKEGEDE
jgi:DNA-directed RNA polymerase subunit RPC12/RpoP